VHRVEKDKLVSSYSQLFNSYESIFLTKNLGLSVSDSRSIKQRISKIDSRFIFIKNSLAKIALNDTQFSGIRSFFSGPITITYSNDPITTSRILVSICNNSKLDIIGGVAFGKIISKKDIDSLSKMPTLTEIRKSIFFLINTPIAKIISILNVHTVKITHIIKSYAEKQQNL